MTENEKIMKKCLGLAARAAKNGDVPVGCAITDGSGKIVARAYNRREADGDPTAHAEILALRKAGRKLRLKNLSGYTLYVTLEPCVMCAGAIVNARVSRVVFGAYDRRFGCCGSADNLADCDKFNHRAAVVGGVLEKECSAALTEFFAGVRARKKAENGGDETD